MSEKVVRKFVNKKTVIYSVPDGFDDVPSPFNLRGKDYKDAEIEYLNRLKKWCQDRNEVDSHDYVGECIRFPVADSYAEYMILQFNPLMLIHIPLMDAWEFPQIHLLKSGDVIEMVDNVNKFKNFMKTQCNVGEVQSFLREFGTNIETLRDWKISDLTDGDILIQWNDVIENRRIEYLVPKFNAVYGEQENKVFKYLKTSFQVK